MQVFLLMLFFKVLPTAMYHFLLLPHLTTYMAKFIHLTTNKPLQ